MFAITARAPAMQSHRPAPWASCCSAAAAPRPGPTAPACGTPEADLEVPGGSAAWEWGLRRQRGLRWREIEALHGRAAQTGTGDIRVLVQLHNSEAGPAGEWNRHV